MTYPDSDATTDRPGSHEPATSKCTICDSDNIRESVSNTDRRKGLRGSWSLSECKNCGVFFMTPMPTNKQLESYYAVYSTRAQIPTTNRRDSRSIDSARRLYHAITGDVDPRDFVRHSSGKRILDYGCGTGVYMQTFLARGALISGVDVQHDSVEACRRAGLDVALGEVGGRIPYDNNEFHIVYLMQVLEHLSDPDLFFEELHRILKPNGDAYIAVPNINSLWRRLFGRNWVSGWFAPYHLFFYNKSSLSRLANKHGFTVVKAWTRTPVSWFQLNLKALFSQSNSIESLKTWTDSRPIKWTLVFALRITEVFTSQRDCLVVQIRRGS